MGKLIDLSGIHFRMLNTSKGAAVWGNRAQADKVKYRKAARKKLEEQESLFFLQGMVNEIEISGESVSGVRMVSGEKISAQSVIVATGTFLDGIIHIGLNSFPAGRAGEPPAKGLVENLNLLGIGSGRLKTGTSPRIDGRSVNFEALVGQEGDKNPWPFSFSTNAPLYNRAVCWMGRSNKQTHQIIFDNLDKSPLYTGKIKSNGPRYCPSIEDKVVRFGERNGHALFLEPESLEHQEMYLNGLSTSLPIEVQRSMVCSISGLEKAKILRPGYGIEYTYFQPKQLKNTLESKTINNLFFAGQINGTSGYEEAAGQGLIAGINAVQKIRGEEPVVLPRDLSYIGVMVDDLVTKGTDEPYRMFTSRAEFRLKLRQDNCDERLMPIASALGLIEKQVFEQRQLIWDKKKQVIGQLAALKIEPEAWEEFGCLDQTQCAGEFLKRPEISLKQIVCCKKLDLQEERELWLAIEAEIKYSGFIAKQENEVLKIRQLEKTELPDNLDYEFIGGLLTESKIKLKNIKPDSLGQAARIPGITPADISIIALHVAKNRIHQRFVSRETNTPQRQEQI